MINLLWVLVAILIVAWLLGLGGVFHLVASLVWVILIVAIVLAVVAFLTGGYRS
ncbi:MAG: lmo0937 family membrane protein [Chloroflexota bacterium]